MKSEENGASRCVYCAWRVRGLPAGIVLRSLRRHAFLGPARELTRQRAIQFTTALAVNSEGRVSTRSTSSTHLNAYVRKKGAATPECRCRFSEAGIFLLAAPGFSGDIQLRDTISHKNFHVALPLIELQLVGGR